MRILQSSIIPKLSLLSLAMAGTVYADFVAVAVQDYTGSGNVITVTNTVGSVTGTTAYGIRVSGSTAINSNTITNAGSITSGTGVGPLSGLGESGYGSAAILIDASNGTQAIGNVITNHGSAMGVSGADSDYAGGILVVSSSDGMVSSNAITNTGLTTASGGIVTIGIGLSGLTLDSNTVLNSGTIASVSRAGGRGILLSGSDVLGNTVNNSGVITASSASSDSSIYLLNSYGFSVQSALSSGNTFTNSGQINVATNVTTSDTLNAYSDAQGYGIAVSSSTATGNTIVNLGQITLSASTSLSGTITDYYNSYSTANVTGIALWSSIIGSGNIISNSGVIDATSFATSSLDKSIYNSSVTVYATGIGVSASTFDSNVIVNSGKILTSSRALYTGSNHDFSDAYSESDGIALWTYAASRNVISNTGEIIATAISTNNGKVDSYASGISLDSTSDLIGNTVTNTGSITATAIASGSTYINTAAYGIILETNSSGNVINNAIANYGTITATSDNAYGIYFYGEGSQVSGNSIVNYGNITVSGSNTIGIYMASYTGGTASFGNQITNWGQISANSGSGTAIMADGDAITINLAGHSSVKGLIAGVSGTSSVLNLAFTGVNAGAKADLVGQLNTIGALSGTATSGTFTFRGVTYAYDPLTVQVNTSSYAEQAKTPNQKAVGASLDSFTINPTGNMLTLLNALDQSGNVPRGLDQLSPQRYQIYGDIALSNASLLTGLVDQRLSNVRFGSEGIDTSALGVTYGSVQSKLGLGSNGLPIVAAKEGKEIVTQAPDKRWSAFLSGNIGHASLDDSADLQGSKYSDASVIGGVDVKLNDAWTTGVLLGYGHTDADLDHQGSTADVDAYSAGVYSGYRQGNFYGNGLAAYTYNDYESGRVVDFGSYSEKAKGSTSGSQFTVNLDGGYDQPINQNVSVGPFAGLQYVHLGVDGFSESQAKAANLNINDQALDSLRSRLGVRLELKKDLSKNWKAASELRAGWQHEFANNDRAIVASFAGSGLGSFTVRTSDPERDRAILGVGLNATCKDTFTVFADYDAEVGSRYTDQIFKGGVKFNF